MQSGCLKLKLSTSHVAYFKKLVSRQNQLCSEVSFSYNKKGITFHGTSATDNIVLTVTIGRHFFNIYDSVEAFTFRVNIYYLHKIIKRVTSFMYHTIHILIYQGQTNEQYSWMHLLFETQNRTDQFHTRIYPVSDLAPLIGINHLTKLSPLQVIEVAILGDNFVNALNRFDKEVFQTISFTFRQMKEEKKEKNNDTKKQKPKKKEEYQMNLSGESNHLLVVRGRTDAISGRVVVRTLASNLCSGNRKCTSHLRKFNYSLEMLLNSLLFYKLSETRECTLKLFTQFKVLCLQFRLAHDVLVDVIIPHFAGSAHGEMSSASDSDSC